MNITPFNFESQNIRVVIDNVGLPWFNANDVCEALQFGNARQALESHVDSDDVHKLDTIDTLGRTQLTNHINESGLYALILGSTKESAKRFKRWVTSEVLPAIRKTGSYSTPTQPVSPSAIQPAKEFSALFRVARMVGLDKNVAAISANQAVAKLTGTNVLQLLGQTHLEADNQSVLYYTPTELGRLMGVSGRTFNLFLAEAGLQAKRGEHWAPLAAAEGFCRILDTGKRYGDGTMIQQIKWAENVISLVQRADREDAA